MKTYRITAASDRHHNKSTQELVRKVVERDYEGAQMRQHQLTHEDGGILEQVFVVLWQRDKEWGTHRVVINYEQETEAMMWGHFFDGPRAIADAYKDYLKRIRDET